MIEDDHVIQATRRQSSQTNPSGRNRRIERIECDETPVLLCMAAGRSPDDIHAEIYNIRILKNNTKKQNDVTIKGLE